MPVLVPLAGRLDDGVVGLRLFGPGDVAVFEDAARPTGNEGFWLILVGGDPQRSLAAHVGGWSAGGRVGPALAVVPAGEDGPVAGVVYFAVRGGDSVELAYGVVPGSRGRGVATRAARLAAAWLLGEGGWGRVELRIGDDSAASQRVAVKAGFRPAGRVSTTVPSAGREFDDLLYVREAPGWVPGG